jgi:hypothetical protein
LSHVGRHSSEWNYFPRPNHPVCERYALAFLPRRAGSLCGR